jgi:hypothetical protein
MINSMLLSLSLFVFIILVVLLSLIQYPTMVMGATQNSDITIITSVTQNLLTVISVLLGTSSFILGLNIQNVSRLSEVTNNYLKILVLALVSPAIFIIIYGIVLVGSTIESGDVHYMIILLSLFIPSGAILFLLSKLKSITHQPK